MAHIDEHCEDCLEQLGKEFREVHIFLDQFAKKFGWSHRMIFHNTYGVEIVRRFFGPLQAEAAKIHIKKDFGEIPEPDDWLDADSYLNI